MNKISGIAINKKYGEDISQLGKDVCFDMEHVGEITFDQLDLEEKDMNTVYFYEGEKGSFLFYNSDDLYREFLIDEAINMSFSIDPGAEKYFLKYWKKKSLYRYIKDDKNDDLLSVGVKLDAEKDFKASGHIIDALSEDITGVKLSNIDKLEKLDKYHIFNNYPATRAKEVQAVFKDCKDGEFVCNDCHFVNKCLGGGSIQLMGQLYTHKQEQYKKLSKGRRQDAFNKLNKTPCENFDTEFFMSKDALYNVMKEDGVDMDRKSCGDFYKHRTQKVQIGNSLYEKRHMINDRNAHQYNSTGSSYTETQENSSGDWKILLRVVVIIFIIIKLIYIFNR